MKKIHCPMIDSNSKSYAPLEHIYEFWKMLQKISRKPAKTSLKKVSLKS